MNDVFSVVSLGDHRIVQQRDELYLGEAGQGLQVCQLLQTVVGEDDSVEVG